VAGLLRRVARHDVVQQRQSRGAGSRSRTTLGDGAGTPAVVMGIGRRQVLAAAAGMLGALVSRRAMTQSTKARLILLGTGGGPRPRTASSASAQVILVNDEAYVVDCGNGVARQLVFAGIPLPRLGHIFLTHHHSD